MKENRARQKEENVKNEWQMQNGGSPNEIKRLKLQQQRLERGEFDKTDLQAILKERGMCTTGSKAELVARLEANNEVLEASRQRELLAQTVAQRGSKAELQEETQRAEEGPSDPKKRQDAIIQRVLLKSHHSGDFLRLHLRGDFLLLQPNGELMVYFTNGGYFFVVVQIYATRKKILLFFC